VVLNKKQSHSMMLKGDYIPNTKFHFKIFLLPLCRARKEERKH